MMQAVVIPPFERFYAQHRDEVFGVLAVALMPIAAALYAMRGEFAEFNPRQVPMGSITEPALKLASAGASAAQLLAAAGVTP